MQISSNHRGTDVASVHGIALGEKTCFLLFTFILRRSEVGSNCRGLGLGVLVPSGEQLKEFGVQGPESFKPRPQNPKPQLI